MRNPQAGVQTAAVGEIPEKGKLRAEAPYILLKGYEELPGRMILPGEITGEIPAVLDRADGNVKILSRGKTPLQGQVQFIQIPVGQ